MVVGNKIDMQEQRSVSKQRGLDFAQSRKIAFYQVSAKDGTNINLIFTRIAQGRVIDIFRIGEGGYSAAVGETEQVV